MAIQYSTTHRTNAMADIATQAGTSATIKIWSGTPPATCATADTGTLLVTLTGNASGLGSASGGVLTFSTITPGTAVATGTAGYFRVYPSAASATNSVLQGTVGTSGTDMIIASSSISSGQTVSISSWTITAYGA